MTERVSSGDTEDPARSEPPSGGPRPNRLVSSLVLGGFGVVVALVLLGALIGFLLPESYAVVVTLVIALPTIIFVGILILATQIKGEEAGAYPAAFKATVIVVPITAALGTVVAYKAYPSSLITAFGVGIGFALVVWLVAALFYSHATAATNANPGNYNLLREQLNQLQTQHRHVCSGSSENEPSANAGIISNQACDQASRQFDEIRERFRKAGTPWVTGDGYIDLWRRIHRAEEALIMVGSTPGGNHRGNAGRVTPNWLYDAQQRVITQALEVWRRHAG